MDTVDRTLMQLLELIFQTQTALVALSKENADLKAQVAALEQRAKEPPAA